MTYLKPFLSPILWRALWEGVYKHQRQHVAPTSKKIVKKSAYRLHVGYISLFPALRKLTQEDQAFKTTVNYITRLSVKKKKNE